MIKDRNGNVFSTNSGQNKLLELLYGNVGGRCVLKALTNPELSKAVGSFMNSTASAPLIKPFIKKSGIDISQYETDGIKTYNEFFTRKIKKSARPVCKNSDAFISPCDSKLSVYKICKNSIFKIKNSRYKISDLVNSAEIAKKYCGGYCMIFRLEVNDYHRYCYIDNGTKDKNTFIDGELHTVNPIALEHYNIYKRNCREYTTLHTENFGDVVQVEVGAMMVGRIANHHGIHSFKRGEEKGMFLFGGSTIVLLIEKNRLVPDFDILKNTADGYETIVKLGECIGHKLG